MPRLAFVQVRGSDVIKYRPYEFFLVAVYLHPVLELPVDSSRDFIVARLIGARCALTTFTSDLIDKYLPTSKKRAEQLISDIDDITLYHREDAAGLPNLQSVQAGIRKFEIILDAEVTSAPIFCLEPVGNLSTEMLIEGGSKGFDSEVLARLPAAAISEIDEAGRCLAFERPTASGFHILRAVEIAIREYLALVPGFKMPSLNRQNWGEFILQLKNNAAAKEVIDALQNIKDNYRNPLMHPMDTLELRQAISLFSVCQGMIEVLAVDIKKRGLA
jgi:hypothetical protein